jgi:cytochrome c-type biogenesis protein CcmF
MGVGPALPWGRAAGGQVSRALVPPLAGAAALALTGVALGVRQPWTLLTLAFGGYTAYVTLRELWLPLRQRMRAHGEGLGRAFLEAQLRRGQRRFGSYVVHAGAVIVIVAIAVSSTMGTSKEVQLHRGESVALGPYTLTYLDAQNVAEAHRESLVVSVAIKRGERDLGTLRPRMNQYETQREPIGTPAVRTFLTGDVYLSIMNVSQGGETLGLLAMINPMVGWIWVATAVMGMGGLIALLPRRRTEVAARPAAPVVTAAGYPPAIESTR